MADTGNEPNQPETEPKKPLENDANTLSQAELQEQLKKERQERMAQNAELNRLRKAEEDRKAADAEAERKKLEENDEYKTLADRERERAEEAERKLAERDKAETLGKAQKEILGGFPQNVADVAATAGLTLTDDSEEGKAAFTEKLNAIAKKINADKKVKGNNMRPEAPDTSAESVDAINRIRFGDRSAETWHKVLKDNPGIRGMKKLAENAGLPVNYD